MTRNIENKRVLMLTLTALIVTGCASMQPTPMMPSRPAPVGRHGITAQADALCRNQAYQAASQVKDQNINTEVASTVIGGVLGGVLGNQMSYDTVKKGPHGRPVTHSTDLAGVGAVAGAAAGASVSKNLTQDTQQVYDITYRNCIEANRVQTRWGR